MITENELSDINYLISVRGRLENLLDDLTGSMVSASIGIVGKYVHPNKREVKGTHSNAEFFDKQLDHIQRKLNDELITLLEIELSRTKKEISKYLSPNPK